MTLLEAFRAAIPGATRTGNVLTLPPGLVIARVGLDGTATTMLSQESQSFQVSVWAATPDLRERLSSQVKVAIARTNALLMPDGLWTGVPRLGAGSMSDASGTEDVWRRDLRWSIDYHTTETESFPAVVFVGGTITNLTSLEITDYEQTP
ncbi:hypothetical protein BKE38_08715 [Pseudoroseomonas deserti]|uniref:Phage tail protein n=1 Tax=Teichococcus deserti TaxID=1817963 RepID=A0A1V2H3Y9_9PROT|nr:hypothetical protein BKE38_08715 [Pseudoroseomonas deserti]